MSAAHLLWLVTGSTLNPMILQLRFSKSGCSPAMYPSSVVHTGVKSLGCENKMAQPLPIHSWKLIVPCEVSAVKLGASSFMRNMNCPPEAEVLYIDRSQPNYWICGPPCYLWDSSRITALPEVIPLVEFYGNWRPPRRAIRPDLPPSHSCS